MLDAMRMRGLLVAALVACTDTRAPVVSTTIDARLDAAAAPSATPTATATVTTTASAEAAPSADVADAGRCADAIADAKKKQDRSWKEDPRALDVDGDGTPECVLRSCYGRNCDVVIYHRAPGGVRRVGKMTSSMVSSPSCMDKPAKGTFCRLDVGVHMIHGETMPTYWVYSGGQYVENGHGELIPGPSQRRVPHP
jgi:hypothetical protein